MPNRNSILRCGYLLPRVLLLWALLDVMLRFAPPQWYAFHQSEFAMITATHRTNLTYEASHAYGDLATFGNCVECRQYRPMNVHIDARGFANPSSSGPYNAILVGDSFGLGAQQPPGATLASQISLRTGLSVYNACRVGRAISREDLMALIDELGMENGTVFFELMDRSLGTFASPPDDPEHERQDRWYKYAEYSPLANVSQEVVNRLYDGRLMPNPYALKIFRKVLPDGQTMLFFYEDSHNALPNGPTFWAKYLHVLDKELRQRNFRLIVILVPSKYTVYQPLIKDAPKTNKSEAFEELRNRVKDMPVVNTTAALQQAAAEGLEHGSLLYWRDDTHWNGDGVRVAADQLQAQYAAGFVRSGPAKVTPVSEKRSR
jgi:hypothetical protein